MNIVYFDCSGGADEMTLLGALLAAGAPVDAVKAHLSHLPFAKCNIRVAETGINGLRARQAIIEPETLGDYYPDLGDTVKGLTESGLDKTVREKVAAVLNRLAKAGERVYVHTGKSPEAVSAKSVAAIVGVVAALEALGIIQVTCSRLPVGTGLLTRGEKLLPNPTPLTLELLENIPVSSRDTDVELLTPAAAALLATLAGYFGPAPDMRIGRTGYGAGENSLYPVRAVTGRDEGRFPAPHRETAVILEANLDDLNPQFYGYVMERLFAAGALDVYLSPIQMKKNRPGTLLRVLCRQGEENPLLEILFKETTTLGIRRLYADKLMLGRHWVTVETPYGKARVKVATQEGREVNCVPEYEDCVKLARLAGVPLKEIYRAVTRAYSDTI